MLTAAEQAELDALEAELNPQRQPAAPQRQPGDLTYKIQTLTPEEEAELVALEQEFAARQFQAPGPVETKGYLTQIGEAIDSYTGAPVRKAIGTFQDTNSISQAGSAFVDQFGGDPSMAPTGKEIAEKAGFSTENQVIKRPDYMIEADRRAFGGREVPTTSEIVSPAGMVGFGIDVGADITNLLPFAGVALKGAKKGAQGLAKGAKAADATIGSPLVKVGENAADIAKSTASATKNAKDQLKKLFRPDVAPDAKELVDIAKNNGIDTSWMPESIEFGERSVISRMARNKAEGPLGGDSLEKFEKFTNDVSNAAEKKIAKIGTVENIPGKQEAGRILREGYDQGVDDFFKKMDFTYNTIVDTNPGIRLAPESEIIINKKMAGIEKYAKGLVKRGITATDRSQGKELLNAVAAYKNAGPSLKQQKEAMNMIGRAAFKSVKSGAELPSDIRTLREMYFTLQKGFSESVRKQLGDDIADALIANNKAMSQHFTERGPIAKVLEGARADEEVFENLVMRGSSKQVKALENILTMGGDRSKWDALRASYLDNLINRNADGVINFQSTRKKLNLKKEQLLNVFSPEELKEVDDILRLGDRAGSPVLSSSGTGASNMFSNLKATVQDAIGGDVLLDSMKKGARNRANYVEAPNLAKPGKPRSGVALLREKGSIPKAQAAKGAQVQSVQERNERLEKYKKFRGNQ